MNFFNYSIPPGHRDRMISPPFNFSGANPVYLSFIHAYANRYTTVSDSLIVYVSDDCGGTWVRVFAAGERNNGAFATVPRQTTEFTPTVPDDWCNGGWGSSCNVIDLTPWANKPNIMIAFESYNRNGNNLFIDNINIATTPIVSVPKLESNQIQVYPNPTTGIVNVYSGHHVEDLAISLFNAQGEKVYERAVKAGPALNETLNLNTFPKGVYLLKINGNSTLEQQKLILQ